MTKHQGRSRGNVKQQIKRRRIRRSAGVKPTKDPMILIDGNRSKFIVGFCEHYDAWLTLGLLETHRCVKRSCNKLVMIQNGKDQDHTA